MVVHAGYEPVEEGGLYANHRYAASGGGMAVSAVTRVKRRIQQAMLVLAGASLCARGAGVHTETFSSGRMGWTNTGTWVTAGTNNALRGQFGSQSIPSPESGSWAATNTSSGGAFVGDYDAAGIRLVGFSFMAQDVLPSSALIRWHGPSGSFFRSFLPYVTATGAWCRVAFSLADKAAGGWVGGTEEAFQTGLTNVQWVEIQVTRAGTAAQRYFLDEVFLDGLPEGTRIRFGEVSWTPLRTNVAYGVEVAEDPGGAWTEADSFSATNREQVWLDAEATNEERRVYRLKFDEKH